MAYILWYLLIGVLLSLGVAAYTYFTRRAHVFDPKRTALVFLVFIPLGWPYIMFMVVRDLVSKRLKI